MRVPLATQLKTRKGDIAKDARLINGMVEVKGQEAIVRKRPGSNDLGLVNAGNAQLLTCWEGGLRSVVGDSLADLAITTTPPTPAGWTFDFTGSQGWADVLSGDFATYNGSYLSQPVFVMFDSPTIICVSEDDDLLYIFYANDAIGSVWTSAATGSSSDSFYLLSAAFLTGGTYPWAVCRNADWAALTESSTFVVLSTFDDGVYGSGGNVRVFVSDMASPYFIEVYNVNAGESDPFVDSVNGGFFAFITDGKIVYNNGTGAQTPANWTEYTYPSGITCFRGVVYTGGYWYFVDDLSSVNIRIFKSNDLTSFAELTVTGLNTLNTNSNFNRHRVFVFFNNTFVLAASDGLYTSADCLTWTKVANYVCRLHATDSFLYVSTATATYRTSDLSEFVTIKSAAYFVDNNVLPNVETLYSEAIGYDDWFFICDASNVRYTADPSYSPGTPGGDSVTATPVASLTPQTASLSLIAESTGAAQSNQQLFFKSTEQAWIYTE